MIGELGSKCNEAHWDIISHIVSLAMEQRSSLNSQM